MSTATDLAELDAAIAENELDETAAERLRELLQEGADLPDALELVLRERDGSEPPPPLPAPAEEQPSEPTDKQLRALDRETARHLETVNRIMGVFVQGFAPCDKCDALGLVPPGPEPRGHEFFKTCETCAGFGQVLTGSLREGRNARDCPACGGNGYLEALGDGGVPLADSGGTPALSLSPQAPATVAAEPPSGTGGPAELTYGRPSWMGDPAIGT